MSESEDKLDGDGEDTAEYATDDEPDEYETTEVVLLLSVTCCVEFYVLLVDWYHEGH